jgi:putative oxidoreductase
MIPADTRASAGCKRHTVNGLAIKDYSLPEATCAPASVDLISGFVNERQYQTMNRSSLLTTQPGPQAFALGLLILRLGAGLDLFLNHGLEKLTGYSTMVHHFPDPLHVGAHFGLAFALLSDGICSVLVLLGLLTRPASAIILINLFTVFIFVHHATFYKDSHGELVMLYIAVFAAILFTGPGRFSLDARLVKR